MTATEYLNKGIEYYNNEDEDKAIVELTEALRLEPNLTEAKKYLALSYFYLNFPLILVLASIIPVLTSFFLLNQA